MKSLILLKMLQEPKYLVLTFIFSLLIFFLYPFFQILNQGLNNYWFWFSLLTPLKWFLYLLYVSLLGINISFFSWQRAKKICPTRKTLSGGFLGLLGGFLATTTTFCPACLSWITLFFPFGFGLILAKYSIEIMIFSVALFILALWLLGGFQKIK